MDQLECVMIDFGYSVIIPGQGEGKVSSFRRSSLSLGSARLFCCQTACFYPHCPDFEAAEPRTKQAGAASTYSNYFYRHHHHRRHHHRHHYHHHHHLLVDDREYVCSRVLPAVRHPPYTVGKHLSSPFWPIGFLPVLLSERQRRHN